MVRRAHHERNFLAQSWLTCTMESHHERKLPARACPDAAMATQAGFHWPARETLNKHGTHSSRASSLPQDQAMVGASVLATIPVQTHLKGLLQQRTSQCRSPPEGDKRPFVGLRTGFRRLSPFGGLPLFRGDALRQTTQPQPLALPHTCNPAAHARFVDSPR